MSDEPPSEETVAWVLEDYDRMAQRCVEVMQERAAMEADRDAWEAEFYRELSETEPLREALREAITVLDEAARLVSSLGVDGVWHRLCSLSSDLRKRVGVLAGPP